MGCPIRKSADQSIFAAPHGLSQRSTSFIASQRQGIHRMPLRHLIALIINTHPEDRRQTTDEGNPSSVLCRPSSDGTDIERPACFGSFRRRAVKQPTVATNAWPCGYASGARRLRINRDFAHGDLRDRLSERSYLFTMSDIARPQEACGSMRARNCFLYGRAVAVATQLAIDDCTMPPEAAD